MVNLYSVYDVSGEEAVLVLKDKKASEVTKEIGISSKSISTLADNGHITMKKYKVVVSGEIGEDCDHGLRN